MPPPQDPLLNPLPKPWQKGLSGPCARWPRDMSDLTAHGLGRNPNLKDPIWKLTFKNLLKNIVHDDPLNIGYLRVIAGRELFCSALRKFGGASEELVEDAREVLKQVTKVYLTGLGKGYHLQIEQTKQRWESTSEGEKEQTKDAYAKCLEALNHQVKCIEKKRAEAESMIDDFRGPFLIMTTPEGEHIPLPTDILR